MFYYEVQVAGRAYHSKKPLTYSSESAIEAGSIVSIPVRKKNLSGFVLSKVSKPSFDARPISKVVDSPPLPPQSIKLFTWMENYYPSNTGTTLQLFMPNNILKRSTKSTTVKESSLEKNVVNDSPQLRSPQLKIIKSINEGIQNNYLLHGETGSGKTRIYAELIEKNLNSGKSALILTPEIGLTAQLIAQLKADISTDLVLLHSQLTPKQKRENWHKIAGATKPIVVIGTRSSLFAPVESLGIIIVDEEHEDAYKQEQAPNYHAVTVAAKLASLHKAKLVLGSATPSVVDYSMFSQKNLPILRLDSPHDNSKVMFTVVDITKRENFTNSPHLSKSLISIANNALANKEQILLFLNRRGTARLVLCQNCGWENTCPDCDIPYTFHADTHTLQCHTCGNSVKPPATCPECKSSDIFYKHIGTKALVEHVQKLFPDARVKRFDTDLGKKDRLEANYTEVRNGEFDILVGTQLLGKGLDLPKLSTVGIIQADSSLAIADFSAREKAYQQLHQIIGRVGRGHRGGHVVIQTYNPSSPLIQSAIEKNYDTFYKKELQERKEYQYPPFCFMLKISTSAKKEESAIDKINQAIDSIKSLPIKATIIGPAPSFKAKTHGSYHWQAVIKSKDRSHLLSVIDGLPAKVKYDIDPINLL